MVKAALSNRSINYLNFHFGLQTFANNLGYLFIGVYLYKIGVPLFAIFLMWSGTFLFRLLIRPFALKLAFHRGLKKSVILGTLLYSTEYLFLGKAAGVDIWLVAFIIVSGIVDVLYWLPYHTYFSMMGDLEHRGKQIGFRDGIVYLANFLAPLAGGIVINAFGFWTAFVITSFCMLLAVLPLRSIPDIPIRDTLGFRQAWKKVSKAGMFLYISNGFHHYAHLFTWPLVLFIMLGDYVTFGGLLSLAVLFQIVGSLWIGHLFDNGNGQKIYGISLILIALTIIGRVFFATTIPKVIFFDIVFMLGATIAFSIENSAFYNVSKKSHHPLWFQFFAENGWDIGASSLGLLSAGFLYFGGELRHVMLLGLLGLMGIGGFLRWYFRQQAS